MADIAIFRINYKSDFILTLNSDAGWTTPFCIKFWTGAPSQAYYAYYDGMSYTHCAPVDGEPTKLMVQFDDHHLPIGDLKFQIGFHFTVADFPTSVEDEVINQASVIIEVDDAQAQVMLDLNGETAPEIEFSLPAYANEAQRISNEEQRIADEETRIQNEETRISAEQVRQQNETQRISREQARQTNESQRIEREQARQTNEAQRIEREQARQTNEELRIEREQARQTNEELRIEREQSRQEHEAQRIANETERVTEFAEIKTEAVAATNAANAAASLANEKAEYAKEQGDYAKEQGDYAKEQGTVAEGDHVRAESDHTRAEQDHTTAANDHTQATSDHTRAEVDHSTASADHTTATNDHAQAVTDHATATNDHTQAGNDHTRAESDHTRAESDHAAVEVYVDSLGAFDISAYNATGGVLAKYADLTAALGTDGANIPEGIRKGGMSVKFVLSSDNKYIQYFLTKDEWSANEADWQKTNLEEEVSQLDQKVDEITIEHTTNLWEQGDIDFTDYIIIGTDGVKLYDAGTYVLSFDYPSGQNIKIIVYGPNGQTIANEAINPSANRVTYSIPATVQIERFFFQSTGNTISLKNVQLELGTVATPYVPPITVADFTARGSLVSHKEEQSLSDYAKALACNNIGAMGYTGSITQGMSLDDTSIKTGFYYLAKFSITERSGFLFVYNYSSALIVQQVVDFVLGRIYTRFYESGSWKGWVQQKDFYSFYKGSLTQSDNINSLFTEGAYYCIGGQPSGDFPVETTGVACLLIVNGIQNFTEETLVLLSNNISYKRTYVNGAWTSWSRVITNDIIGFTSPNLLNNENSTFTQNGITFTVNADKTVTISGSSTGMAAMSLPCTLPKGKYILSGMPANSSWGTWYFLFVRGDGTYQNITYQYYPQGYIFEVTEETETVNAYIRIDGAGLTIPDNTVFSPMIQRYPYRTMDYAPYGREQYRKPIYDLIDCTEFNWSGKKINVIGDSIVAGASGNWVNHIAAILALSEARNYGIGGCRLAYYGDGQSVTADDSVVARYASMDNDADIVIIHAGTNDWASQVPLGSADSTNQLEFNGALNIIMSGLRTKYPTALIIFDAIMERVDYDAPTHGGVPMPILTSQYSECIKQRCNEHHFLFFDSYKEFGLDFTKDYTSGVFATTNDGLHPNINGAKIIGRKLAAFINGH